MTGTTSATGGRTGEPMVAPRPGHPRARRWLPSRDFARRHWLILAVLAVGVAVRILACVAYRPALEFVQDSYTYLGDAQRLVPDVVRPSGYSLFLRLLAPTGSLAFVVAIQHLLGLATGVVVYAMTLRLGARPALATLAAAPVLLDGYQIDVEHFILSETLFEALVVAGLVALLVGRRSPAACAAAGLALAASAVTRTAGLPLLALAAVYLLVRRAGVVRLACLAAGAAVVLVGYAGWFRAEHGRWAIQAYDGYFLAGRVLPVADCAHLRLPAAQQALCDPRPESLRPASDWYVWDPASPLRRPHVPPGTDRNDVARRFALHVIAHQPGSYLALVAGDVVHYFAPGQTRRTGDGAVEPWQFFTTYQPLPWSPEVPPADPYVWEWTFPGWGHLGATIAQHGFDDARITPEFHPGAARVLHDYQRFVSTPGPLLAVFLVVGLAGAALGRRAPADQRWASALLAAAGVTVLVTASATSVFDYRYRLPVLLMLPAAGVLGWTALRSSPAERAGARPGSRVSSANTSGRPSGPTGNG